MNSNPIKFVNLQCVCARTSLCKTSVYTIPDFPRPIKIGGAGATAQGGARWIEGDVVDLMQSRISMRDAKGGR